MEVDLAEVDKVVSIILGLEVNLLKPVLEVQYMLSALLIIIFMRLIDRVG